MALTRVNLLGGVYFFQAANDVEGPVKIGYSANIKSRKRELLTGSPYGLKLLGYLPNRSMQQEKQIHDQFKHLRIRGEWFEAAPELLKYIRARCVSGDKLERGRSHYEGASYNGFRKIAD